MDLAGSDAFLGGSAFCGVGEAAEARCDSRDRLLVALLRKVHAVAVLAVGLDDTVDELPRLHVRIQRLRHGAQFKSLQRRSTINSANHMYQ